MSATRTDELSRKDELTRILGELEQLERELLEQRYVRRADGSERVSEALRRLGEAGSPAAIIARSATELGQSAEFDGVLVSRVQDGRIHPLALWARPGLPGDEQTLAALADPSLRLAYPLVEAEVAQRHEPAIVSMDARARRVLPGLSESLGWGSYAVAGVVLEGKVSGFVHGGRLAGGLEVDDIDLELASRYAEGLSQAFERAVLREQLQRQRAQLDAAAHWIGAQTRALSAGQAAAASAPVAAHGELTDLLTARELDVMRLVAQGRSNRAIAIALVLGEGTVKYHIKNILRKLQARSRTEAISRYLRLQGGDTR